MANGLALGLQVQRWGTRIRNWIVDMRLKLKILLCASVVKFDGAHRNPNNATVFLPPEAHRDKNTEAHRN
jgi:hypothetical protein